MLCLSISPEGHDAVVLETPDGRRVVVWAKWRQEGAGKRKLVLAFDADPGVTIYRDSIWRERHPGEPVAACGPHGVVT